MSDACRPFAVFRRRLLANDGNKLGKSCRYELFTAKTWALVWSPGDRRFFPALPSVTLDRQQFWETRIRLRIDGKWYKEKAAYHFLTSDELAVLLVAEIPALLACQLTISNKGGWTQGPLTPPSDRPFFPPSFPPLPPCVFVILFSPF